MGFGVSCWNGSVLSGPNSPAAKPWTCKACVVSPAACRRSWETCGVGLIERQQLRRETGLPVPEGEGMVLLFSRPRLQFQLMQLQR